MKELVLFVHSTGTGPMMWLGIPDAAIGERERLCPAHVGYPPGPPLERGVRSGVREDADRIALALAATPGVPTHVVAHSYGALVALAALAALGDRIASLFFYEPVLFGALAEPPPGGSVPEAIAAEARAMRDHAFVRDDEAGGREAWLEAFIDYWNRPGAWQRMPEALRDAMRPLGWKMYQEVRSCFFDVPSLSSVRIDVPLTVARGERSPEASRAMSAMLVDAHAARASLVEAARATHMAPLTQPALVAELMAAHFARLRS